MKLGEEILRCQPFAYVVSGSLNNSVCDGCFKRANKCVYQRCSGCKYVYYCSQTCQRSRWALHRTECAYLKAVHPKVPTDTVRLMARIILKLQCGGGQETASLPNGGKRRFDDLMSHHREVVRDAGRLEAFNSFFEVLQNCLGEELLPPKTEVLEIYGRILINSFNIMDDEYQTLGIGLYLAASVLDHSCRPNAQIIFHGKDLIVRCIQEDFHGSFDEVRISYINLLNTNYGRKKDLMDQYYFECDCESCQNDSSEENLLKCGSVICPSCSKSFPVNDKPGSCPSCSAMIPDTLYTDYSRLKGILFDSTNDSPKQPEMFAEYYNEASKIFSPFDRNFIYLLEQQYEAFISAEDWENAFEVGSKLLTAYQRLYPVYDVNTALMLMKLGKLTCYLNRMSEAEKYLESASKIVLVTHGRRHPFFAEILEPLLTEIKVQLSGPQPMEPITKPRPG